MENDYPSIPLYLPKAGQSTPLFPQWAWMNLLLSKFLILTSHGSVPRCATPIPHCLWAYFLKDKPILLLGFEEVLPEVCHQSGLILSSLWGVERWEAGAVGSESLHVCCGKGKQMKRDSPMYAPPQHHGMPSPTPAVLASLGGPSWPRCGGPRRE